MDPGILPGSTRTRRTPRDADPFHSTPSRPLTMETRAHHLLIGSFAILAFLIGLGFVLWLSKTGAEREFRHYDVVFTEAVTGLSKGGLVQYNGIKVGEVSRLSLDPRDPRKVIARVRLEGGTPVKQDTV